MNGCSWRGGKQRGKFAFFLFFFFLSLVQSFQALELFWESCLCRSACFRAAAAAAAAHLINKRVTRSDKAAERKIREQPQTETGGVGGAAANPGGGVLLLYDASLCSSLASEAHFCSAASCEPCFCFALLLLSATSESALSERDSFSRRKHLLFSAKARSRGADGRGRLHAV